MAGFKKKLPMSAAMRQGGEGTVPPPKPRSSSLGSAKGSGGMFGIKPGAPGAGAKPKGPTQLGAGVKMPKEPSLPKAPTIGRQPAAPKLPTMPKVMK